MKYNGNLDSLRAFAALAVVGFHYNNALLPFGWAGVQLFFVLSGFLISGIVVRNRDAGASLREFIPRFFVRRSLRLLPLFFLYLLLLAAACFAIRVPPDFDRAALGLFTYTQNWHKLFPNYPEHALYGHLWSLCVEWQFYLIWPFVLWMVPTARRTRFLFTLLLLGPAIRFVTYGIVIETPGLVGFRDLTRAAEAVYVLPLSHIDAFAFGALLCRPDFARRIGRWPVAVGAAIGTALLGVVAIAASGGLYPASTLGWPPLLPASFQWVWGYSALNFLSASVIALVLLTPPALTRLPWLQYVGRVSYGVYVFHAVAVYSVATQMARRLPDFPGKDVAGALAAAGAAVALAGLSHRFLEAPLQHLGRRLFPSRQETLSVPAKPETEPTPTIGDVMAAYASDATAHAHRFGFALDYSEASLAHVDEMLAQLTKTGVLSPQSPSEEKDLWLLSKLYGGYLGQVVIRELGGAWEMQDLPDGNARAVLRCQGVQMFPPEKIFKRLTEDEHSGIAGYCRALRLIIARQGEAPHPPPEPPR